jgi:UDP-N-acetylmuramoyl-tripeptide--D-alanyl-D-alanine ligase
MLKILPEKPVQAVTYFGRGENCTVRASDVCQEPGRLMFRVNERLPIELELEGDHFVSDAMAAVAVGLELGVSEEQIRLGLARFHNMEGRQETFEAAGCTIIKDCYNAGPESMIAALNVLGSRKTRRIAVLGDMLELGDRTPAEHYRLGRIAAEKADVVFAYGPNAERVISGALTGGADHEKAKSFGTHSELAAALKRTARPGDVILFKGSRGMHMEVALEEFLKEEK